MIELMAAICFVVGANILMMSVIAFLMVKFGAIQVYNSPKWLKPWYKNDS